MIASGSLSGILLNSMDQLFEVLQKFFRALEYANFRVMKCCVTKQCYICSALFCQYDIEKVSGLMYRIKAELLFKGETIDSCQKKIAIF